MFASLILSLREGLEAALIIGIVLGTLRKMNRRNLSAAVWFGAGSATLVSLAVALLLTRLGVEFSSAGEEIFEGITMLVAAALLTWMIFWMRRQSRHLKEDLESSVERASRGGWGSLFLMAFVSVLREGIELALFLTAAAFTANNLQTLSGTLLGLGIAFLLGWLVFAASLRLNLERFFQITGILLLFFAAGLAAHGVHEFNEVGWIPPVIEHVWDINPILDENSPVGLVLKSLLGYNGNPSLTEVIAFTGYIIIVLFVMIRRGRKKPA